MISVDEKKCTLCGDCVEACPWQAISLTEDKLVIDHQLCAECGACLSVCPVCALYQVEPGPVAVVRAELKPVSRTDVAPVVRPATPRGVSVPAYRRAGTAALLTSALPYAVRFAGGLANWWLDRRRLATCERQGYGMAPRPLRRRVMPIVTPAGPRRLRRRQRGGSGR
jgi:ferredoxin